MDILIKGMKMPNHTTEAEFGIDADGSFLCIVYTKENIKDPDIYEVVELAESGEWIKQEWPMSDYSGKISKIRIYTCSQCGEAVDYASKYCPNCGIKMSSKVVKRDKNEA